MKARRLFNLHFNVTESHGETLSNILKLMIILIFGYVFTSPYACFASMGCYYDRNPDIVVCPPPNGGIAADPDVKFVCGIGWCAVDVKGNIKCSKVPGGAAVTDQYGNALCVGGCMDAVPSLCQRLVLPRFDR